MDPKETAGRLAEKLRASLHRYRLVWFVILVGLILLLIPTGSREKEKTPDPAQTASTFDLADTEARLAQVLSQIDGAGKVTVMLTVRDGPRQILAQDQQRGEVSGGERTETVVLSRGSGSQETVTVQELYPSYQGALLVCDGGDDPQVRLKLTQAVSALTGLGADKISISKGK